MGEGRGGGVESSLEVDVDHRLDLLRVQLEERPVGADAGVGDHDVEAAVPLDELRGRRADRLAVADVADEAEAALEAEVAAAP